MSHNYARPITLMQPERLVFPPAWVGHIPFAFWIVEAARPRRFVELGTHTGNSFGAFAQAVRSLSMQSRIFAVDHWRGDEHAGKYDEDIYREVEKYFNERYSDIADLLRMNFDDAVANFEDDSIDLLHIDGLHTYEAVKHDFETWLPKMSGRGVVLLHDTNVRERDFGVFRLIKELSERYPVFDFIHSNGLGVVQTGHEAPDSVRRLITGEADDNGVFAREYFSRIGNALVAEVFTEMLSGQSFHGEPFEAGLAAIGLRKQEIEAENEHLRTVEAHLVAEQERFAEENRHLHETLTALAAEQERLSAANEALAAEKERLVVDVQTREGLLTLAGECLADGRMTVTIGRGPDSHAESKETLPFFDPTYYLKRNPDVAASGMDPLLHYLIHGRREGRLPKATTEGPNDQGTIHEELINAVSPEIGVYSEGRPSMTSERSLHLVPLQSRR